MRPSMLMKLALCALALLVSACSSDAPSSGRGSTGGAVGNNSAARAGDAFHNEATGTVCPAINLTQGCQCGDSPGRQLCGANRVWGTCECLDVSSSGGAAGTGGSGVAPLGGAEPAANKGDARFEWLRTAAGTDGQTGSCQPGSYGGVVDGIYNAPSAFNAPVPIVSVDVTGAPGLQLELSPGGSGEFLEVTGGSFNGVALAIFPFMADLADGQLNCTTGEFNARIINGSYIVFFDGFYGGSVMYQFEGVMVARYDSQARALVDGRWSVSEGGTTPPTVVAGQPPPIFPPGMAGGTGTWSANYLP